MQILFSMPHKYASIFLAIGVIVFYYDFIMVGSILFILLYYRFIGLNKRLEKESTKTTSN